MMFATSRVARTVIEISCNQSHPGIIKVKLLDSRSIHLILLMTHAYEIFNDKKLI